MFHNLDKYGKYLLLITIYNYLYDHLPIEKLYFKFYKDILNDF